MLNKKFVLRYKIAKRKWQERNCINEHLGKESTVCSTPSGISLSSLYGPDDCQQINYPTDVGYPGSYPFVRGIQPTMYRGRLWTMRQYAGFGTAEATNERFKYLIKQGQTGLSVAFDLPTQIGYDSDHPNAIGEVGKVGVAISSIEDLHRLFDGIPLDKVSTSMTINATAPVLLAMYLVLAKKNGVPWGKLSGTVQNDILKEYIARGTYIYPIKASLKLVTDVIEFCQNEVKGWNAISISGYHMREAGCNAIQELAFTFANAITYIQEALKRGLQIDSFAPRLSFFFNSHNDFLEEIAKFRAARKIWAKIIKERFNAKEARSCQLRFHTQTAGSTLTAQQPYNNLVRVTIQALAAVLGGTQSLHTNAYDEALSLPSEEAALLALRTQQIIAYESGVINTIDPVAGSFAIESLVNEIEKNVFEYIDKIETLGGMIEAIKMGYVQKEIQNTAYAVQKKVENGLSIVVGINKFTESKYKPIPIMRVDPSVEITQIKRLKSYKEQRDKKRLQSALDKLKDAATALNVNIIPFIIRAIESDATLGEICNVLREVYGVYKEESLK